MTIVSGEPAGDRPAGPGLRAAGLAIGLRAHGVDARAADLGAGPEAAIAGADVVVVNLSVAAREPGLLAAPFVVVDAGGPFLVESLWVHSGRSTSERRQLLEYEAAVVGRVLARADLVLVASDAQRSLLLGILLGGGLLRPELIDADPGLAQLIAIVPFGAAGSRAPGRPVAENGLRVVWPGGLWDWLDPGSLVEAVALARGHGVEVALELWGTRSPDPLAPVPRVVAGLRASVIARGLDDLVSFVDWVPYQEVPRRLADFDLAATLDPGGIEARFAYRTRLVQALACGVPTLATRGEPVAELAAAAGAGWVVEPGASTEIAELLVVLGRDPGRLETARQATIQASAGLVYERLVGPLAAFCLAPRRQRPMVPGGSVGRRLRGVVRAARGRL